MLQFKSYKGIALMLFLFVFIYLLLRSYFVEPLHDEVSVLYMYFESGKIFEKGVIQDAGNHLLQTYLSHYCYRFFGDSMFSLRLPIVLSYAIYFFGTYKIVSFISVIKRRFLLLLSLNTIPFIIEYFANARGYGMALAFFMWLLFYSLKWSQVQSIKNALGVYIFAYFSVFSVIVYFPSAFLAILLIHLLQLKNFKTFRFRKHIFLVVLSLAFLISLFPFYYLSLILKNGGGFYHGSLTGIWESTGKSLATNVFFTSNISIKFILIFLFIFFLYLKVKEFNKSSFWNLFSKNDTIILYYFFGNLICILLMALKLNVNFPEDRVAMHLVILFILSIAFVFEKFRFSNYIYYSFLFFSFTFLLNLSLSTSVFSNDNRMSTNFYKKVRKQIKSNMTIGLYPMQELCWSYHEKHNKDSRLKITTNWERDFNNQYDLIMMKENRTNPVDFLKDYKEIAYEPLSGYHAFIRKTRLVKKLNYSTHITLRSSNDSINLAMNWNSKSKRKKSNFICSFNGNVKIDSVFDNIEIRFDAIDQKGIIFQSNRVPLRWYYGSKKLNIDFSINQMLKNIHPNIDKINCYIWNPQNRILIFRNVKLNIYEIIK